MGPASLFLIPQVFGVFATLERDFILTAGLLSKLLQTCELSAVLLFSGILPVGPGETGAGMAGQIRTKYGLPLMSVFPDPTPPRGFRIFAKVLSGTPLSCVLYGELGKVYNLILPKNGFPSVWIIFPHGFSFEKAFTIKRNW